MKLIIALMGLVLIPAISIFAMVHGWGLEVKSWPIVIGSYAVTMMVTAVLTFVGD